MILPPENPYGHTKKLRYFLHALGNVNSGQLRGRNEPQVPATVLDFGCGNGTAVTQYLCQLFLCVVAVESDEACLEYVKRLLPNIEIYSNFFDVNPDWNPSTHDFNPRFDAIVCSDVLEHLEDPETTLRMLAYMLKPNGFLIGSIPNGYGLFELENRLYKMWFGRWLSMFVEILLNPWRLFRPKLSSVPYNNGSPHVQFLTLDDFFDLIDAAGFYIADLRNGTVLGSPPFTAHILEKSQWLMNMNGYIADHLKPRHASTWLFKLVKK